MIHYYNLFICFARVGLFTFGGGYAMLPILQRELVTNRQWLTETELADCIAIGQCTPGIIAVNTATFVGYKQRGALGSIAATAGIIFPSLVIIILIASFLQHLAYISWISHAFAGIRACVCALIAASVWKLFKSAVIDAPAAIIYCAALLAAAWFGLSPVLVVVAGGILGFAARSLTELKK